MRNWRGKRLRNFGLFAAVVGTSVSIEDLFAKALEISAPDEREQFIGAVCAGKPQLREELDTLLRAHQAAGAFLRDPEETPVSTVRISEPLPQAACPVIPG